MCDTVAPLDVRRAAALMASDQRLSKLTCCIVPSGPIRPRWTYGLSGLLVYGFPRGLFLVRRAGRSEAVQVHSLGIDVVGVGMTLHDKPE